MENKNKGKAVIFSAPSGAGKTTIVHHLLKQNKLNLAFSISATSRPKRGAEVDGKDYYFLSASDFRTKVANGDFIEWEEVYPDQMYGTLKSEIERIWASGRHVIFDVDVVGGLNLKRFFGDAALGIFVQPPDLETLESRLRGRGTETEEKIQTRLAKATSELERSDEFDFILVNHHLFSAFEIAEQKVKQFITKK
ncbi:MAG: guanylate kinase [Flavobacteriales bacterium]|nr:guanylate kinase [Flavobacteriales bacterium]